jgi:hypothetical protein
MKYNIAKALSCYLGIHNFLDGTWFLAKPHQGIAFWTREVDIPATVILRGATYRNGQTVDEFSNISPRSKNV